MILDDQKRTEFHEAAKPLIEFLNDNCHPHCTVVVDCGGAELLEGVAVIVDNSFIKD